MKSGVLFVVGLFLLLQGVLYALQGAGVVTWPHESFMINNRDWIERGIVVALIGLGLILSSWRIQKKP